MISFDLQQSILAVVNANDVPAQAASEHKRGFRGAFHHTLCVALLYELITVYRTVQPHV